MKDPGLPYFYDRSVISPLNLPTRRAAASPVAENSARYTYSPEDHRRAAMILTALLSLGFPKPPDYSVLSRRLASLKSDEVRVRAVLAMDSLRETTAWQGSSSSP